jgi:aspartate kinase
MDVYKFESSGVDVTKGMQYLLNILVQLKGSPSVLIVPALGSSNHTLEAIAEAYFSGKKEDALQTFQTLFDWHVDLLGDIPGKHADEALAHLDEFRTEVEWLLHDKPVRPFDYYYDQIVCAGALMASVIIAATLKQTGFNVHWTDVRDIIRTDDQFTRAQIDLPFTTQQIQRLIKPAMVKTDVLVTQGFIGVTDENESTTLGKDGMDKTVAVFASCLDAEVKTI